MELWTTIPALAALALCACAVEEGPQVGGELRVGLFGEGASGQTYRLRDATFDVAGGPSLSSEGLPDGATSQSTILAAGDYSVLLQDGFFVERELANGAFAGVDATLASANPADFTIDVSTTTNVTFVFNIEGDGAVPFDEGTLEIDVDFDDADADCPDENADGFCDACGDDLITAGEECDGSDMAGESCGSLGFSAGNLACDATCNYNTGNCTTCGDGIVEGSETCELPGTIIEIEPCGFNCIRTDVCDTSCQVFVGFCECF